MRRTMLLRAISATVISWSALAHSGAALFGEDFERGLGTFAPARQSQGTVDAGPVADDTEVTSSGRGRQALILDCQPGSGEAIAVGGPMLDLRDPTLSSLGIEARLHVTEAMAQGDGGVALVAADDSGAVTPAARMHRFGYRAGTVFHQFDDGRTAGALERDDAAARSLSVPGWHTFQLRFEGQDTVRCFVDGREASFSPIAGNTLMRFQAGVAAAETDGHADDLRVVRADVGAVPSEVIVESGNVSPEAGHFHIVSGGWQTATVKSRAAGTVRQGRSLSLAGGEVGTAAFVPNVPAEGAYEIFATWPSPANASDVLYTITHADGRAQVRVDQDGWGGHGISNASRWISLGIYRLHDGAASTIHVSAQSNSRALDSLNPILTFADAIRLVPTTERTAAERMAETPTPVEAATASTETAATQFASRGRIAWRTDLALGQEEARRDGRSLVVLLYREETQLVRRLVGETLNDRTVVEALNAAVPVRLSPDDAPEAAQRWSVFRLPTLIVFEPDGTERGRLIGRIGTTELLNLLNP